MVEINTLFVAKQEDPSFFLVGNDRECTHTENIQTYNTHNTEHINTQRKKREREKLINTHIIIVISAFCSVCFCSIKQNRDIYKIQDTGLGTHKQK